MLNLIRKELALCMHPTAFIFLFFAVLVFVPNYPYEVIFFFSCLSVFFCCMMTRENGDIAFSCALPVKKEHIPLAKMLVVFGLQGIVLLLVGIIGAVKGAVLPAEQYVNQAGISANLALVGNGAVLLGVFLLIGVFIVLRWATPLYSVTLNGLNSVNSGAKTSALTIGMAIYTIMSVISCKLSMKRFQRHDA